LLFRFSFDDAFAREAIRTLCNELRQPREYGSMLVDSLSDSLWLHLCSASVAPAADPSDATKRIGRAVDKLKANLEQGISIDELADEAGMSRFHFARAFRNIVGEPPHRFLVRKRIEMAKELLKHGNTSMVEVAISVGFCSQSHFCTSFRNMTGQTPLEYRSSPYA
jgi:AraC family transcriptional regulator